MSSSGQSGTLFNQTTSYNNAGNVISNTTTQAKVQGQSVSGGSQTENFCYDAQNHLLWAGNSGTQPGAGSGTCGSGTLSNTLAGSSTSYNSGYAYTNLGQLWQGPVQGSGQEGQYLYCNSQPHQLSGIYPLGTTCANKGSATAVYSASYDPWGNVTSRTFNGTTATLSYDIFNQMVAYSAGSNSEQYAYDAGGERVLKRSTASGTTSMTVYAFGLEEYQYHGDGSNMGGTSNTHYYSLGGLLLGKFDGTNTTFYLTDGLGSVVASFSNTASSAAVLGNQTYEPYGKAQYQQGSPGTSKGYTGQYADSLSSLDYYNARYYDPVAGIFLSPDSVQGNLQGLDPYTYVGGNPETLTDPTGHGPCEEEGIICQGAKTVGEGIAIVAVAIVALAIAAIETVGFAWNHHSPAPNGLKPQPAPTPTPSHALDGIGVAGIQSAAQTAQNAVHLADMQAITQGIMQGAIQSTEDAAIQAAEGSAQQAGVGVSGGVGRAGGAGGAGGPPRRPPTSVTPPPPQPDGDCGSGQSQSLSKYDQRQALGPLPPTPGGMSLPEFGNLIGWGKGQWGLVDSWRRMFSITDEELTSWKQLGFTQDIAQAWADRYAAEYNINPANETALGRNILMQCISDLLK